MVAMAFSTPSLRRERMFSSSFSLGFFITVSPAACRPPATRSRCGGRGGRSHLSAERGGQLARPTAMRHRVDAVRGDLVAVFLHRLYGVEPVAGELHWGADCIV